MRMPSLPGAVCLPLGLAILCGAFSPAAAAPVSAKAPSGPPSALEDVTFRYVPPPGTEVQSASVRGSFNGWGEAPMTPQADGSWAVTVPLAAGEYQYKFFVNGEWPADMSAGPTGAPIDPEADGYAPDGYGGRNAVRAVGGGEAHAPHRDPAELEARMDAMRAVIGEATIRVFPVILGNEGNVMVAELVALFLERCGLDDISVEETPFNVSASSDAWTNSAVFGAFVRGASLDADYALLGEFRQRADGGLEVRGIVVDREGRPAWVDSHVLGGDCEPMEATHVLVQRLRGRLGLPDPDREDAPEGVWAEHWRKRSGLPPEEEQAAMKERMETMRAKLGDARVVVCPILQLDGMNHEAAASLAKLLEADGTCGAEVVAAEVKVDFAPGPSQMRRAWDMARGFQAYVREHDFDADYVLCAEYLLDPERHQVHAVNIVMCDAHGDWVVVEMQNSHQEDFQAIAPRTVEDCNRLVAKRMARYAAGD